MANVASDRKIGRLLIVSFDSAINDGVSAHAAAFRAATDYLARSTKLPPQLFSRTTLADRPDDLLNVTENPNLVQRLTRRQLMKVSREALQIYRDTRFSQNQTIQGMPEALTKVRSILASNRLNANQPAVVAISMLPPAALEVQANRVGLSGAVDEFVSVRVAGVGDFMNTKSEAGIPLSTLDGESPGIAPNDLTRICQRHGVPPADGLFLVGRADAGIAAARVAQLRSILLEREQPDDEPQGGAQMSRPKPDFVIKSAAELSDLPCFGNPPEPTRPPRSPALRGQRKER